MRTLCTCFQNASSLYIHDEKVCVISSIFLIFFLGGKFLHLGDQKVGSSKATRTFFFLGKKLGTSLHFARGKILKSPHLDNRFQHVTKNIRGGSLPLLRLPTQAFYTSLEPCNLCTLWRLLTKTTYIFMK